ncbi:MAG TPA: glycoside hydrolase family 97 catalytic domain-containing protein [Bacteroidales bacterium]|nr:glycoside hydrolase family 97 catalytic domain-containing protein [Bacteroidales bacterium]
MKHLLYFLLITALFVTSCSSGNSKWSVDSPSGNLQITVFQTGRGDSTRIVYSVDYLKGDSSKQAVLPSPMGITRSDGNFVYGLEYMGNTGVESKTEDYRMIVGKRLENHVKYNSLTLSFENRNGKKMDILLRAYDAGVAFSYSFPEEAGQEVTITGENTGFYVNPDGKAWIQPYDTLGTWSPAYEYGYIDDMDIGTLPPMSTGWGYPALFHTSGLWMLISEAGLYDYCGTHLSADCAGGKYKLRFPGEWENYGYGQIDPKVSLPYQTPWRFILLGETLKPIVESNLVNNLAKPSVMVDTGWIKPGKSSWSWWSDHTSGRNYKKLKEFVDFSARMGWKYSLVDADWNLMEGGTLEELAEYAKSKGVGLTIWYNSGGPHTKVMDAGPRDLMFDPVIRDKEMQRISKMGIKGIKVDFFQGEKPVIMKLYQDIARDAAKYHLLLDTHGCTIPRGWTRTYPNYVTMEGVRGAELYGYWKFPEEALRLNTTYPFTRNVLGPMDYTPVTFSDYSPETKHLTTNAHELALSVVFESGIQHFADKWESYEAQPEAVIDFLKTVPVTWDDTKFIDGYPGKFAVLARKKGDIWYVAGNTGEEQGRKVTFIPDFLDNGNYSVQIFKDGNTTRTFSIDTIAYATGDDLTVDMARYGGFTMVFTKK